MSSRQVVDVGKLVQEVYAELSPRLAEQHVELLTDVASDLTVLADGEQLRQAIFRLATNALTSMPKGGKLWITALVGPHGVELEFVDSGPGLSDDARRKVFRAPPMAGSTIPMGQASDVSLEEVRLIVAAHGGSARATNCPEGGAAFILQFPRAEPNRSAKAA